MSENLKRWVIESALMFAYFLVLVFSFLPAYLNTYAYMLGKEYVLNTTKFGIAAAILFVSNLVLFHKNEGFNPVYLMVIRFLYLLTFVPMLALYSCGSTLQPGIITEAAVFQVLLLVCLRYYAEHDKARVKFSLQFRPILQIDYYVFAFCGIIALITWAYAGFPMFLSFGEGYEQRMALRQNSLPTILNYLYMMMGGAILPFLFIRNLVNRQYGKAILSLAFGMLLFFVNGMKTWLIQYAFGLVIVIAVSMTKNRYSYFYLVEMGFIAVTLATVLLFRMGILTGISLLGRVTTIPNNIGFKFVDFFRTNELLYLRESILRFLSPSPYPGGSEFFINYGAESTVTSSRANNGLYGDAFRNFGMVGILIYPFLFAKVFNMLERNCRNEKPALQYFVMFILVWGAINSSFFTWLLTGGIILMYFLMKVYNANKEKERIMQEAEGMDVIPEAEGTK